MHKITVHFLMVSISILIAVLILEIALRCIGFSYPSFYMYDPATGSAHRPGAEGWWREEGQAYVKINSSGMRDDREFSAGKPPGVYRIAILGDSFTEAFQVAVPDSYWRVLETRLNGCAAYTGKKVEVLNFGVAGYSTAHELLALRSRVWSFQPDMVVLAFCSGNDVRDNHPALSQVSPCPFFVIKDGSLLLDTVFQSTAFRIKSSPTYQRLVTLLDHAHVFQFANKVKRYFIVAHKKQSVELQLAPSAPSSAAPSAPGKQTVVDIGLDNHIYLPPQSKDWQEAWRITEALIAQMHTEVVQHGARFLLVTVTNGIQVHPDPKVRNDFAKRIGSADLLYPDKRIQSFAAVRGIEAVILALEMQKLGEQRHQYFHGFPNGIPGGGHWNEKGHRIAGEILAGYLCSQK